MRCCRDGRRGRAHRPAAGGAVLSGHRQDRRRLQADGRRGGPSRLRLPLRDAGVRRRAGEGGIVFIGPNPNAIDAMGDKIEIEEGRREGRRLTRARPHRRDRRRRARRADRRRDRLSGDDQGHGRRRRQGHPRRLRPQGRGRGLPGRARRGQARFGDDRIFIEKFVTEPAPHRDPGAGRQARQRRPPVRARMLDPAPQPEGHRRGAVARCSTRRPAWPWASRPSPWRAP